MEYAKKMVILSPEELSRFQTGVEGYNAGPLRLSVLDEQMKRILNLKNITDSEKWGMYKQVLHRFLHVASDVRRPLQVHAGEEEGSPAQPKDDVIKNQTLEAIPSTLRRKAELLYNKLKSAEDKFISWDDKGTVSIQGNKVNGSSITDLISDAIRDRKGSNPLGWHEFAGVLSDLNIPQEFIGNTRRRTFINATRSEGGTPFQVSTPTSARKVRTPRSSQRWIPYNFSKK